MKHKTIKLAVLITILIFNLFSLIHIQKLKAADSPAPPAMSELTDFATNKAGMSAYKKPTDIIISIINVALSFVGLIFLIMIIYSGFQWMTSGGNEEVVGKAKKRIINSVIGIAIILLSWIIANTIILIIQNKPLVDDGYSPWPG